MLQAKMSNGKLIVVAELTRTERTQIRKNKTKFYCPACDQEVIVKAGSKVIPHFAHRSSKECSRGAGGEGEYHHRGKLLLYRWLKSQGLQVTLEQYIQEIEQRPDLYLRIHDKKIAIEYQCAKISVEEIHQRNAGYHEAGITPIWILGESLMKRKSPYHFQFDQMTLQLVHQFTSVSPTSLYYFCPYTLQMIRLNDLYLIQPNRGIVRLKTDRLNQLTFKDLFQYDGFLKPALFNLWKKEKKAFRLRHRRQAYGVQLSWLQWLYLKQTHIEHLPSMIHLPISSQHCMKTPVWNWQSRLCLDIISPLQKGSSFTLKRCEILLRNHIHPSTYYSLIHETNHPIEEYLLLLEQLEIIKKKNDTEYIKTGSVVFHHHVEEAIHHDDEVVKHLVRASKYEFH